MLGTAILVSYERVIRTVIVPGAPKPKRALLIFMALKYVLIGAMLYGLVRWHKINIPAFCGGIALVHFAILAKLAGVKIVERRNNVKMSAFPGSVTGNKES